MGIQNGVVMESGSFGYNPRVHTLNINHIIMCASSFLDCFCFGCFVSSVSVLLYLLLHQLSLLSYCSFVLLFLAHAIRNLVSVV
jgi:hypothetical protein